MVFGDPNDDWDEEGWKEWLEEQGFPYMTQDEYLRDYCAEDIIRDREDDRISAREYLV
jgi:uncharacterized phage protein gp47/JayE